MGRGSAGHKLRESHRHGSVYHRLGAATRDSSLRCIIIGSLQNGTQPKPPLCKGRWVRRTRRDCAFLDLSFSASLLRRRRRAFSCYFRLPESNQRAPGRFKPPPGPPGEGANGLWCAFPEVWRPRPKAPLTRNGSGTLPIRVNTRKLLAPLGSSPQHRKAGRNLGKIVQLNKNAALPWKNGVFLILFYAPIRVWVSCARLVLSV